MKNPEFISAIATLYGMLFVLITFNTANGQRRKATVTGVVDGDSVYQLLPVDGIPAIRHPEFVSGQEANDQMSDDEPVMGLNIDGDVRAYSLWQLDAHEIVNDQFGELLLAVTW